MANEFTFLTGVEQASDPATPDSGDWRFYFKADGFFIIDDTGSVIGPFGSFGASGAVELLVDNETGGTLTAGTPVYVSGYNVGADLLEVTEADATDDTTMPCIGLVKADIVTASTGTVVVAGLLNDLDTTAWNQADLLYVSETAGTLTSTAPTGSAIVQQVAEVVRDNVSSGALLVQLEQTAKTGFTATLLDDGDAATARATLGAAAEQPTVNTVGATGATEAISWDTQAHDLTMDEACTFSFADAPTSGDMGEVTVIVRGAFTPTWPAAVDWPGGVEPTYATPTVYRFVTVDAGTTVLGFADGTGMA